jgi:hypothetical protein
MSEARKIPGTFSGSEDSWNLFWIQEMLILLGRKCLEPTLRYMTAGAIMSQVATDAGGHQPGHPAAQVAVLAEPEGQMEVVWA